MKTSQYKVGDKVKVKPKYKDQEYRNDLVQLNKWYTVSRLDESDGTFYFRDDEGDELWAEDHWFILHGCSAHNDIDYAKSLVGKLVDVKVNGRNKQVIIDSFAVYSKHSEPLEEKGKKLIERDGYCVIVEDKNGYGFVLDDVKEISNKVVLNDEYTAVVDKDNVVVGCQTISIEKIKEILKIHTKLTKG
jgi:hypothetical protein